MYKILAAGIASLMIALGISRFAYTPMLPLMKSDFHITNILAGNLASVNYAGYFAGAVLSVILARHIGYKMLLANLSINVLTTLAMGLTSSHLLWFILRFCSGFSSAFIFVAASAIVLDKLIEMKNIHPFGYIYGGVGIGIVMTAVAIPVFNYIGGVQASWIGLGILSLFLCIFPLMWLKKDTSIHDYAASDEILPEIVKNSGEKIMQNTGFKKINSVKFDNNTIKLMIAYGLFGTGYIIMGTFMVEMMQEITHNFYFGITAWLVVGIAATPSTVFWTIFGKSRGNLTALKLAFSLQIAGLIISLTSKNLIMLYAGAFFFGLTFMGIVTLAISLGKQLYKGHSTKLVGYLTAFFGLGQIIGPVSGGYAAKYFGNFKYMMIAAVIVLTVALILLFNMKADTFN